jgi:hypothetical protein
MFMPVMLFDGASHDFSIAVFDSLTVTFATKIADPKIAPYGNKRLM